MKTQTGLYESTYRAMKSAPFITVIIEISFTFCCGLNLLIKMMNYILYMISVNCSIFIDKSITKNKQFNIEGFLKQCYLKKIGISDNCFYFITSICTKLRTERFFFQILI